MDPAGTMNATFRPRARTTSTLARTVLQHVCPEAVRSGAEPNYRISINDRKHCVIRFMMGRMINNEVLGESNGRHIYVSEIHSHLRARFDATWLLAMVSNFGMILRR
jgi:hypothetical protein